MKSLLDILGISFICIWLLFVCTDLLIPALINLSQQEMTTDEESKGLNVIHNLGIE